MFITLVYFLPIFFLRGLKLRKTQSEALSLAPVIQGLQSKLSLVPPQSCREEGLIAAGTALQPASWTLRHCLILIPHALWLYNFCSCIWDVLETSVLWILTSVFLYIAALYFWAVGGTSCTYKNIHLSKDRGGFLAFSCFICGHLRPTSRKLLTSKD